MTSNRPPLAEVLADAVKFAHRHGVEHITPADFALQRSDAPPAATTAAVEDIDAALRTTAVRDQYGAIRRSDGLYLAAADVTADELKAKIARYDGATSPYQTTMRSLYQLALDLLDAEAVAAAHGAFVDGVRDRLDLDAGLTAIIGPRDEQVSK